MTKEQSITQKNSTSDLAKDGTHKKVIKLPVRVGGSQGPIKIAPVEYNPNTPVTSDETFCKGIIYLMETQGADYDSISIWAFREACDRNNVTCQELHDAYWKAYADPYVGKEGIQFRHLYKHIKEARTGGRKPMSYMKMLDDMHNRGLPMDAYKQVDETDSNGNKKWILK